MMNHSAAKGEKEGKSNPTSHCHLAIKDFSLIHQLTKQKNLTTVGETQLGHKTTTKQTNKPHLYHPYPNSRNKKAHSSFGGMWFGLVFSFNVLKQDVTL